MVHRNTVRNASEHAAQFPVETADHVQRQAALHVGRAWTEGMAKEMSFNNKKLNEERANAIQGGTLLDKEIRAGDVAEAAKLRNNKLRLKRERQRKAEKRSNRLSQKPVLQWDVGLRVLILPGAAQPQLRPLPEEHCVTNQLCITDSIQDAQIVVVRSPGHLPTSIELSLLLLGGIVCDHAYFVGQSKGHVVHYLSAVRTGPRFLWFSKRFKNETPELFAIFQHAIASRQSTWKELATDAWIEKSENFRKKKQNLKAVGITHHHSQDHPPLTHLIQITQNKTLLFCSLSVRIRTLHPTYSALVASLSSSVVWEMTSERHC